VPGIRQHGQQAAEPDRDALASTEALSQWAEAAALRLAGQPFRHTPASGSSADLAQARHDGFHCSLSWPPPDTASHIACGFPHDFLAGADFTLGGMSSQLDLPPGRTRHG